MYTAFIRKELLLAYREKTVSLLCLAIWCMLLAAFALAYAQYHHVRTARQHANDLFRQQWVQQQRNPHDAAHFGTYLFKQLTLPGIFDPGLNDYTGTTYRVEAHFQHEVDYSDAGSGDALARSGPFSVALVCQLLVPLLMLLAAASSVTTEKEAGTLRLLLAQGQRPAAILWTKIGAYYLLFVSILLPFFILFVFAVWLTDTTGMLWPRSLLLAGGYLMYYLLLIAVAVGISALANRSGNALLLVLSLWLISSILLPKIAANQAADKYPLMPRALFEDRLRQGYLKGLNGQDPYYERNKRFLNQLLAQYRVTDASQLPVNASALIMQYDEDYQSKVFEQYYQQIENSLQLQQHYLSAVAAANPFMALKRLSMALSGTDYYQHSAFYAQARRYRNQLIRSLNMDLSKHPDTASAGNRYVVGPNFFRNTQGFRYCPNPLPVVLRQQRSALCSLAGWLAAVAAGVTFLSKRLLLY